MKSTRARIPPVGLAVLLALLGTCCVGDMSGAAVRAQPAQQSRIVFERNRHLYTVTPDGSAVTGPIAADASVTSMTVSPDGRYIAATAWEEGELRILRILPDLEVVEVERLRSGLIRVELCIWSPDGRYLAVVCSRRRSNEGLPDDASAAPPGLATPDDARLGIAKPPSARDWTLYVFPWRYTQHRPPDQTDERPGLGRAVVPPLTFRWQTRPAWAPGSDALAYARRSDITPWIAGAVCVLDLATGHSIVAASTEAVAVDACGAALAWSPDGKRLAYTGQPYTSGIFITPADGSAAPQLLVKSSDSEEYCGSSSWSPRGSYLAFARSWGALTGWYTRMSLWALDLESGREVDLTGGKLWLDSEGISRWAYGSLIGFGRLKWEPKVALTGWKLAVKDGTISWSPDGSLVAFSGGPVDAAFYESNLYVADPRSGAVSVVAERCDPASPDWCDPIQWLPPAAPRGSE